MRTVITTFDDLRIGTIFKIFNQYDEVIDICFVKVTRFYGCRIDSSHEPECMRISNDSRVQITYEK
jgi:hypothetical protein